MAIFSYRMGDRVRRGAGQSAVKVAAYQAREYLVDSRTGYAYNYCPRKRSDQEQVSSTAAASAYIGRKGGYDEDRKEALFVGLYAPENAPDWCRNRESIEQFWSRAELAERRQDAQIAERIIIALPHELTLEQNIWLMQDHVKEFTRQSRVCQVAIHAPEHGDSRNVHAHLLVSMRGVDEHGFKASKAEAQERYLHRRQYVRNLCERWEEAANRHLARHGHMERIDHRTLAEQGIDRAPTIHLGPSDSRRERRGERNAAGEINREISTRNTERATLIDRTPAIDRAVRIARLKHDSVVDRVPSGWRDLTTEDLAREMNPRYAESLKELESVKEAIVKAGKAAQYRQIDKTRAEDASQQRSENLGIARKVLHKIGLRDRQIQKHEKEAKKAEWLADKMRTRRWALGESLRQAEAKRDAEFEKVRPQATASLSERKARAESARTELREMQRQRERERTPERSRHRARGHDWER